MNPLITKGLLAILGLITVSTVGLVSVSRSVPVSSPSPVPVQSLLPIVVTTPKPQTPVNQQVDNKPVVTHDGSRTGRIVDYRSLCEGKVIKVYENELIPYKRINGEVIYTTTGDIKCYEDQIRALKEESNYIPQQINTTTLPSYPPCTIYYPALGYSQTYNYTSPETCKQWQENANSASNNVSQQTIQPTSTPTSTLPTSQPVNYSNTTTKCGSPQGCMAPEPTPKVPFGYGYSN